LHVKTPDPGTDPGPPRSHAADVYPKICSCGRLVFSEDMGAKHRCGKVRPRSLHITSPATVRDLPHDELREILAERARPAAWCAVCLRLVTDSPNYSLSTAERIRLCAECLRRSEFIDAATVEDLRAAVLAQDADGRRWRRTPRRTARRISRRRGP